MISYLAPSARPVCDELEADETIFARNLPDWTPIRALRSADGKILTRWQLTDAQRAAIAAGADVFLELVTYGRPFGGNVRIAISEMIDAGALAHNYGIGKR